MDNLKCLFDHVSAHASVDFIDACETLCKELSQIYLISEYMTYFIVFLAIPIQSKE